MPDDSVPRRKFLLGAGLAGTALAAGLTETAEAQQPTISTPPPPAADTEPLRHAHSTRRPPSLWRLSTR